MKISDLKAREILDSRGMPTLETELTLSNGLRTIASVPSGASTGQTEAIELRDNDPNRYKGKGVLKAVSIINTTIKNIVVNQEAEDQEKIDRLLLETDGTGNKSNLGGNSILGVSLAVCRAGSLSSGLPLYRYLGKMLGITNFFLPEPQILVLEGGKHGDWATDIQEFMIIPKKTAFFTLSDRLMAGIKVYESLRKVLLDKDYSTGVGFEGAFCPHELKNNEEALEFVILAIEKAGYIPGENIGLALDAAASEFMSNGRYELKKENSRLSSADWQEKISGWITNFPINSVEDFFDQEDWSSWSSFTAKYSSKVQIVGDDLLTTNIQRIKKAISEKAVNSVLIKPNQIGTVSETLEAIKLAKSAGFKTIVSHRGGETNDDFIADLAVGIASDQCKFGGPVRGERVAKYNRLLKIEGELNKTGS